MHYTLFLYDAELNLLRHSAANRSEALIHFGKLLNQALTLEETGDHIATYMLDEWQQGDGPHVPDPSIPVYAISK